MFKTAFFAMIILVFIARSFGEMFINQHKRRKRRTESLNIHFKTPSDSKVAILSTP